MISWRFLKSSPKIAVVGGILAVSTALFAWWWMFRSPAKREQAKVNQEQQQEAIRKTVAEVKQRLGHLFMIDNDLYDLETGEVFFKNWLEEGVPMALYLEPDGESFLARYDKGFVRYGLDGERKQSLLHRYRLPFDRDLKWVVYCKDKDIWRAEIDWEALKFINERQVTKIGQFNDQFFAENLIFGTDQTLVVRVGNNIVRVNIETGEIKPGPYLLSGIEQRRSPDSKHVVGFKDGHFYCHNIDSEETKIIPFGGGSINGYHWLGNDRCAVLVSGKAVAIYDRLKHGLEEIAPLPVHADFIGEPSPDGRFVITSSRNGICVANLQQKKAAQIIGGMGMTWINNDTLFFSRDIMDTNLRGSWIQKSGEPEKRIWEEPFVVNKSGAVATAIKESKLIVFATHKGVMRMNPDGMDIKMIKPISAIPGRAKQVSISFREILPWKAK